MINLYCIKKILYRNYQTANRLLGESETPTGCIVGRSNVLELVELFKFRAPKDLEANSYFRITHP